MRTHSVLSVFFKRQGITLIESLLYVAITSGVTTSMVLFSLAITDVRSKNYVAQEVQSNGRGALEVISSRIRSAVSVDTSLGASLFDTNPGRLVLVMANPSQNPTIFDVDGSGILQISEGPSSPLRLTSDEVRVAYLVFTNQTSDAKRENVRIDMTLEYNTLSGSRPFTYSKSWQTAVSVRQ